MPPWVPPPPLELQLWYGDLLVADLHQVFPHQGTWFAPYATKIRRGEGALQDGLLNYSHSAPLKPSCKPRIRRGLIQSENHATCDTRTRHPAGTDISMGDATNIAFSWVNWETR